MADGDVAIHFNFRPDRARELTRALGEPDFDEFDRGPAPQVELTTLTEYHDGLALPGRLPAEGARRPRWPRCSPRAGERQLHVAETEKYAHVTYFFNGGREEEWEGEERALVDSPRDVPTYDHKPRDERRELRRERSRAAGTRATTGSGSSTSPTPTWSATPARSPPRSPRSRPSTAAWAR